MSKSVQKLFLLLLLLKPISLLAQGENLYNDKIIHTIRFTSLASDTWQKVVQNYDNDNKDYVPVSINIDGTELKKVGLRIKGNRLNRFPDRPKFESLKVDLNEYEKKQTYDGLKKLNIKNRNIVANHLLYKFSAQMGIASCRTSLAKVYFDDEYIGSYLLIEQIDKTYLKQHFKSKKGNLYKASGKGGTLNYLGEDVKRYEYPYEKKTNKTEKDYKDLIALLKFFTQASSEDFAQQIESKMKLKPFLKALAIEMFVNKRDAFYDAGRNYYLYNDPETKVFHYIVDDFDYTLYDKGEYTSLNFNNVQSQVQPFVGSDLIKQIIKSDEVKQKYYAAVAEVLEGFKSLDKELDAIENLTKGQNFKLYDHLDFSNNTATIKAFIQKRIGEITKELKENGYDPSQITAVEALESAKFAVYPTLFKDKIRLEARGNDAELVRYRLFNLQGACLRAGTFKALHELTDLAVLPAGAYVLELTSATKRESFRLIK